MGTQILGKILYNLREKGLSESDFAKKLGLSRSTITDWKTGKTKSYMRYIPQIADILDVSTSYLLEDVFIAPSDSALRPLEPTDEDIKFALFGTTQIDDEVLDEVKRFAKYIKDKKDNGDKEDI